MCTKLHSRPQSGCDHKSCSQNQRMDYDCIPTQPAGSCQGGIVNDVTANIANMRYLMNRAILQMDTLAEQVSNDVLDLETIKLNIDDVQTQMTIINRELTEASEAIAEELNGS